jgi:pyridoxine 5-phosphate synthase
VVGLAVDLGFLGGVLSLEGGDQMDAAAAAHRADLAGADLVVIPLGGEDRPGFSMEEARRVKSIVRKRVCVAIRGIRMVEQALALRPSEVLFLAEGGGPLPLDLRTAGTGPLADATARVRAAGVLAVLSVEPEEPAVLAAQDAGATAVELAAIEYGNATTDDAAVEAHRRLAAAARTAAEVGLRVRAGGGSAGPVRVSRLAEVPEIEQIRVGAALLAGAFYEGIGSAVTALRREIARGARRAERQEEEEE